MRETSVIKQLFYTSWCIKYVVLSDGWKKKKQKKRSTYMNAACSSKYNGK